VIKPPEEEEGQEAQLAAPLALPALPVTIFTPGKGAAAAAAMRLPPRTVVPAAMAAYREAAGAAAALQLFLSPAQVEPVAQAGAVKCAFSRSVDP